MNRLPTVQTIAAVLVIFGLISGCGGDSTHVRAHVFGGAGASYETFPSLAYVLDRRGQGGGQCTGTVVAPRLVLTAGHCVENPATGVVNPPSGYRVLTGNVESSPAESQISRVSEVIVYPGYPKKRSNDAALLVLETPTSSPSVTLAEKAATAGAKAALIGWEARADHLLPIRTLRAYTVVQSQEHCEQAGPFNASSEICTESEPGKSNTGACVGDSGGPLITTGRSGDNQVEIGIVRAGLTERKEPCSGLTLSTRVDAISSWTQHWIGIADAAGGQSHALARTITRADAVNLVASDVPNTTEVELGGVTPPTSAGRAFAKCDGGVNPSLRTASICSPILALGHGLERTLFTSAIVVLPTAAMAARDYAASLSRRGARCAMALEARPPVVREGMYVFHNSRPVVSRLPNPLRGVEGISGYRAITSVVEDVSRAGKERFLRSFRSYIDDLGFLHGNERVMLLADGQPQPPPATTERRLLSLLYTRAETAKP
jgi:hypothetical protein